MPTRPFAACSAGRAHNHWIRVAAHFSRGLPSIGRKIPELLDGKREYYWYERRYLRTNGMSSGPDHYECVRERKPAFPCICPVWSSNISEQKRGSGEFQASEVRFRAMFDMVSVGMSFMSLDRRACQLISRCPHYRLFVEEFGRINAPLVLPARLEIGLVGFQEWWPVSATACRWKNVSCARMGHLLGGVVTLPRFGMQKPASIPRRFDRRYHEQNCREKLAARRPSTRSPSNSCRGTHPHVERDNLKLITRLSIARS